MPRGIPNSGQRQRRTTTGRGQQWGGLSTAQSTRLQTAIMRLIKEHLGQGQQRGRGSGNKATGGARKAA
jgi:hypothetical protein